MTPAAPRLKFLLVLMDVPARFGVAPHFQQGVGALSALLKREGFATELLWVGDVDAEEIDRKVRAFGPDAAGFSVTSGFAPKVPQVISLIRKHCNGPIVMGGAHPTVAPEEALEVPGIDGIVRGEGDLPLLEYAEHLARGTDPTGTKNFWFRKGRTTIRNEIGPRIRDLDSLPFPDREVFDFHRVLRENPIAEFMFSRGCPFQCTNCINADWNALYRGKGDSVRFRTVQSAIAELKQVKANYPEMEQLELHDDTFTLNRPWMEEFCHIYPREVGLPFACNVRPGTVDDKMVTLLKEANCTEIRMGIEAGNDYIRRHVLKRPIAREDIVRDFGRFRAAGIRTWAFNIIGLPCETPGTIEETIELNRASNVHYSQVSVFVPYPGSGSRRLCEEMGWLTDRPTDTYFQNESIIDQPGISQREVAYYNRIFRWRVMYPRLAPFVSMLCRIPVGGDRVAYDLVFPMVRGIYRYIKFHRDVGKRPPAAARAARGNGHADGCHG